MNGSRLQFEPWALCEEGIDLERLGQTESLFALSNGHIGIRGTLDEGEPSLAPGTFLGGFYESYPLAYGERGYGFAEDGQAVVGVTDGTLMRLQVEDEPLDVHRGAVEAHKRRLDFRTGQLERTLRWRSSAGHRVEICTRRLVSLTLRSVVAIEYEVHAVDKTVRIALQSNIQANPRRTPRGADPRSGHVPPETLTSCLAVDHGLRAVLVHRTRRSQLTVAAGMDHIIDFEGHVAKLTQSEDDLGRVTLAAELRPGAVLRVVKLLAYHWSGKQSVEWLRDQVDASLESARDAGFDGLAEDQIEELDRCWEQADIELDGDDELQHALRFAMFHILQASLRTEGRAIPAKGLTGNGYDGHAFWDAETFVLPVLTYTVPDAVRGVLEWRHSTLDQARERARQLGLRGAALPWRTIHGEECSGYWPAGTAAFHVGADVASAVRRYIAATHDEEFAAHEGLELLVETARLWMSLGFFSDHGEFEIDGVTGPDEYSALVDNNVYTNLMAQQNLTAAADLAEAHRRAAERLEVTSDEIAEWRRAAEVMHVPFDSARGIHPQDESFLDHRPWDFEHTPPDHYPLMLHYPYVLLYSRQVVKQADLVLAMMTRGDAFTHEEKCANFAYYEAITVHDSSLSACPHSVIAAEVGQLDLALEYLRMAALIDLHDTAHNTAEGLHLASLAGAVIGAVAGFGGLRDYRGEVLFRPRLPQGIDRLRFALTAGSTRLRVEVRPDEAEYALERGSEFRLSHWDEDVVLGANESRSLSIPPAPEVEPVQQPPGREAGRPKPRSEPAESREGREAKAGAGKPE